MNKKKYLQNWPNVINVGLIFCYKHINQVGLRINILYL